MGDGKAKSCAFNFAVALNVQAFKDLEKAGFIFFADTDTGIGNRSTQIKGVFFAISADIQRYRPGGGIFYGIVE